MKPGGRILLIEDEPSNSRLIEVTLRPLGLETVVAVDGPTGLAAARDWDVEAIILDLALPKLDGWQVLDRIRSDPVTMALPVIVLTAHVGDQHVMRAADSGADVFMTKPFRPNDLRQAVEALVAQRRRALAARQNGEGSD